MSSSEELALVLDHSALALNEGKEEEERRVVYELGELLPKVPATWFVSLDYLKTLHSVMERGERRYEKLPLLQGSLKRVFRELMGLARSRSHHCKPIQMRRDHKLKLHVISRSAFKKVKEKEDERVHEMLIKVKEDHGLGDEDVEVMSITLLALRHIRSKLVVVTSDRGIINAFETIRDLTNERVEVVRPTREFLGELEMLHT